MQIVKTAKAVARNILGPGLTELARRPLRPRLRSLAAYRSALRSKQGLEIGGPSAVLAEGGDIAIYDVLESLDNCLYAENTIWEGEVREGNTFLYHPGKPPGTQIISEATDLESVEEHRYQCVLACHCLEHIANPLRALKEWKRVLKHDGLLLLVLPHKDGTFDWRRPVTPLSHMIADFEKAVGEEDLTHLPEILELHDLSKDVAAGTKEQFHQRCLKNPINRAMHHHVFDTRAAVAMVDHAGFNILRVDQLKPFHIIILASPGDGRRVENGRFMEPGGKRWSLSPFPSDQKYRES
jgi:hypothetical protein